MRRRLGLTIIAALAALAVATLGAAPASADSREIIVTNGTDRTIEQVYVSSASRLDWDDNLLVDRVIEENGTVTINFSRFTPGDCFYAIKAVTSEGDEGLYSPVNLCDSTEFTIH